MVTHDRKVVLVVEDEAGVREALGLLLDGTYTVLFAEDGPAAIERVRTHTPDLVLLDLGLPSMNGLDVLAEIQTMAPQVPVVVVTITATAETVVRAMKSGAADYITKPFRDAAVFGAVQDALTGSPRRGATGNGPRKGHAVRRRDAETRGAVGEPDVNPRCLVLAGHMGTAATLKLILERYVATEVATDAVVAMRFLGRGVPDCIVFDGQAWAAGGVVLARLLRADHPRCRVALVARRTYPEANEVVDIVIPEDGGLGELVRRTLGLCALGGRALPPLHLHDRVAAALDYLRVHYADAFTAESVARAACVSRGGLAGLFRAELGVSLTEYISALRVEIAKLLLDRGGIKLDEVATQTGFFDASHLSRAFRRQTGRRPGAYRYEFVAQ